MFYRKVKLVANYFSLISLSLSLGCLFHFAQAVWRNIQSNHLSKKYSDDETFRLNIKKLVALAFVPVADIIQGFELVAADLEDEADDFLDYFERTWVGEPKKRGNKINTACHQVLRSYVSLRCRTKKTIIRPQDLEHSRSCHRQSTPVE